MSQHVSEPIDFLVENKAKWDFEKSVLWLDDKPFFYDLDRIDIIGADV